MFLQDIDVLTYTKAVCAMMDIPVYDNPIESLHLLFSLYLEFKSNPVFLQAMSSSSHPTRSMSATSHLTTGSLRRSAMGTPNTMMM